MGTHVKKKETTKRDIRKKVRLEIPEAEEEHAEVTLFDYVSLSASLLILVIAVLVPSRGIVRLISFLIPFFICGYRVLLEAFFSILRGRIFDENFLMSISSICAFFIGEYPEAVSIMLFYRIGELIEHYAENQSRKKISAISELRADRANVDTIDGVVSIDPADVRIGNIIIVFPGERVPLDGTIIDGSSNLDLSSLTGESIPQYAEKGHKILSGSVNITSPLKVRVDNTYSDSTASRILRLIEDSVERKSKQETFIKRFAKVYTPIVVILAILIAIVPSALTHDWSGWIRKALVFLVVSCPCALVISVPLAYFAGIGNASQHGILIKGSNYLETLSYADTFVFDKTGTLTEGSFSISQIESVGLSENVLVNFAAAAEEYASHPIALALKAAADPVFLKESIVSHFESVNGRGVTAMVNGAKVCVGNAGFAAEHAPDVTASNQSGTSVFVVINDRYRGCIVLADKIKKGVFDALEELRTSKAKKLVMLTGDVQSVSRRIASSLNFDLVKAELLPEDKVAAVEYLMKNKNSGSALAFVGDGVNDAPVLARSDIGIAMGALGSDAAIEAADVVIMDDDIGKVPLAVRIADFTVAISKQNIYVSIAAKIIIMLFGLFGIGGTMLAVFGDVGIMIFAVLNSLRALYKKY